MTKSSKLDWYKVQMIRELYAQGWSQRRLAVEYQLSAVQVGRIVRNESWVRPADALPPPADANLGGLVEKLRQLGVKGDE